MSSLTGADKSQKHARKLLEKEKKSKKGQLKSKLPIPRPAPFESSDPCHSGSNSDLLAACYEGKTEEVRILLKEDIDVNEPKDSKGATALMLASQQGHTEIVKLLLNHGAKINQLETDGESSLMKACMYGHHETVQVLLESGAHVNIQNITKKTALMMACRRGDETTVQLLLDHSADIHVQNAVGNTALTIACERYYNDKVVQLLLDYGAQIQMQNLLGETALMIASYHGNAKVVACLLDKGANVNAQAHNKETALIKASTNDDPIVAKQLIQHGADVNMHDEEGKTALMAASYFGYHKVIQLLLESDANKNAQNNEGRTALMVAIDEVNSLDNKDELKAVKLLLEYGADTNLQNKERQTALMVAVDNHCPLMVLQLLLDSNANTDVQDNKGQSALTLATKQDDESGTEIVEFLLENGAKVDLQEEDGYSALMIASEFTNTELTKLLLQNDAKIDLKNKNGLSSLMIATLNSQLESVSMMLQRGAQVDIQNNIGQSPLMMACMLGLCSLANLMLEYGAQIDLKDKSGKSALMYATESRNSDLAISLIELGAQINQQDNEGWSPLMYAVKAGDTEAVQLLVAYGANIHLKTNDGKTIVNSHICPHELLHTPIIQELFQTILTTLSDDFSLDSKYPGIIFLGPPVVKHIDSEATQMDYLDKLGISISIPEFSLSTEDSLDLTIRPCFSGPFKLPRKCRSASPAYLIQHSKRVEFQKDIILRIRHHSNLQSEEDCEDMQFFTASSTPEYKGSRPIYYFKKIRGAAKTVFRPGDQVGEISLRHFCLVKAGKRMREQETTEDPKRHKEDKHSLYSVRLYQNVESIGPVSAVFCVCLWHPIYTKHCDSLIAKQYTGMTEKRDGLSQVCAEIDGSEVEVHTDAESCVTFDKTPTKILKRDIHLPELMHIDVKELTDYPPRLSIYMQPTQPSADFSPPKVQVIGLDRPCSFQLRTFAQSPIQYKPGVEKEPPFQFGSPDFPQIHSHPDASAEQTQELLSIDDLGDVLEAVEALSANWRVFCIKLRLRVSDLDLIEQNNPGNSKTCLCEGLSIWLRQNYDHQRHGKPSWRRLAEATKTLDNTVFEKITKSYAL